MPTRTYTMVRFSLGGQMVEHALFRARTDVEAIQLARGRANGLNNEIWNFARRMVRFEARERTPEPNHK